MKTRVEGFLIAVQFFTAIPVKKSFDMDPKRVSYAVRSLPLTGIILGLMMMAALWGMKTFSPFSDLASAFFVWILAIILTGGLHLDGWMDASDAYFSYRDKEKRLEIMKDPRTGAFGVLSVLVLLSARFLFIYEITVRLEWMDYFLAAVIPLLSRIGMGILLACVPPAKKEGLASFFHRGLDKRKVLLVFSGWIVGAAVLFYAAEPMLGTFFLSLVLLLFCFTAVAGFFIVKQFNGVTGDLLGASAEGGETVLWMGLWLLHYFAMA
ncbi:adenosylcobinamide-GDP ribazoletransferase [Bacillus sp. FJAT-42376]|uniref:adenosylcobinamide-GDP ribazoletransferase n=1 Tax=Bacillus sp. FJAT-42376 TaxID=2014076 RepID=UPI000F4F9EE6|nr:adenosylcobinamide-GDP ribazoletransferase [Bacillus sp. FJAT-42376]AZB42680.1 adenosylcobinamide-GDP ribazoletransferase [Bacillus sp. FJAT-42376]